jgi:hypothetical protein
MNLSFNALLFLTHADGARLAAGYRGISITEAHSPQPEALQINFCFK